MTVNQKQGGNIIWWGRKKCRCLKAGHEEKECKQFHNQKGWNVYKRSDSNGVGDVGDADGKWNVIAKDSTCLILSEKSRVQFKNTMPLDECKKMTVNQKQCGNIIWWGRNKCRCLKAGHEEKECKQFHNQKGWNVYKRSDSNGVGDVGDADGKWNVIAKDKTCLILSEKSRVQFKNTMSLDECKKMTVNQKQCGNIIWWGRNKCRCLKAGHEEKECKQFHNQKGWNVYKRSDSNGVG